MPKSKMQLPLWPNKMSRFDGKRTEKSAKEIRFFLFGRQGELQKSCSTSAHTNILLEMSLRDRGWVVRTRPTDLMKMSKMIVKVTNETQDTPSSCYPETRMHLFVFPLTLPKFVCF